MAELYFLEVESIVTAGSCQESEALAQLLEDAIQDLSLRQQQSERARIGFNNLLKYQRVLVRCSFGLMLNREHAGYQRFDQAPCTIELAARLLETNVPIKTGETGLTAEIVVSATYESIGGVKSRSPKHLPMILGNWYALGGCGNPRTYLASVARLSNVDCIPSTEQIAERTTKRQNSRSEIVASTETYNALRK